MIQAWFNLEPIYLSFWQSTVAIKTLLQQCISNKATCSHHLSLLLNLPHIKKGVGNTSSTKHPPEPPWKKSRIQMLWMSTLSLCKLHHWYWNPWEMSLGREAKAPGDSAPPNHTLLLLLRLDEATPFIKKKNRVEFVGIRWQIFIRVIVRQGKEQSLTPYRCDSIHESVSTQKLLLGLKYSLV